ncbi:tripartite tricarboxylate transporter permease [Roseinatronobacter alkalisoli]|uniref:Tripartite tricarboxylate transporter permease n=1 Tax=Roseinatronobacter alkalisoli TaxID=3028235 RepID=A0ABT5TAZ8_9RHOB|nr:tripartite tricarboxylate transporter permease [Roseinatronobacter sp. HJB301]MDD7972300.1 tripartite tricarboxylate transporter permease [Roseinatronobacter sp. HJB301]
MEVISQFSAVLAGIFSSQIILYIMLGAVIGTLIAVLPGIGGLSGVALLLPFTFGLDPYTAIAFLLATLAVTSTADSIPAILFGVPGTPASMVTVLDGHPMAKRGEAGRAMGAAFTSSVLGGIFGAAVLLATIPFIMPVMMRATSPELLGLVIFGLAMVAAVSGQSLARGIGAACLGVLLAYIGQDPQTATLRWTFGQVYLWDGVGILLVALGIYALPELVDMAILNTRIAQTEKENSSALNGEWQGVKDALSHPWLMTKSSGISAVLGVVPAIGAAVIPWLVYAYVSATTRGKSQFGNGDVRGVIAVESSNNATVGGALLPTLTFGIPGSAPMALILGGLLLHGIAPGPDMLVGKIDFTYMMIATIVVANIFGGFLAFGLTRWLAKLVFVRSSILVPIMLSIVMIGAVQSSRSWGDVIAVILIGILGWLMKRARWSRAPFFLAFILAPLVDRYFHISMNIHGWDWVARPFVWPMLVGSLLFVVMLMLRRFFQARRRNEDRAPAQWRVEFRPSADLLFSVGGLAVTFAAFVTSLAWTFRAGILPQIVSGLGIACCVIALVTCVLHRRVPDAATATEGNFDIETDFGQMTQKTVSWRAGLFLGALCVMCGLGWLIGLPVALIGFVLLAMIAMGERPIQAFVICVATSVVGWALFEKFLRLSWPNPLYQLFGG